MLVQDDGRENELIELFLLSRPGLGRSGTDAILDIDGAALPFELKSTTKGSVTTVRDFGPAHVAKWLGKHWLIGVYDRGQSLLYCLYGTPDMMDPWIRQKSEYVATDFALVEFAQRDLTEAALDAVLGHKDVYSLVDARRIQKQQYSLSDYMSMMDAPDGYSRQRMMDIMRDRIGYLVARGSTLNNPHIPASYFVGWPRIEVEHAETLRSWVRAYQANGSYF